jgi:hypothetical protein
MIRSFIAIFFVTVVVYRGPCPLSAQQTGQVSLALDQAYVVPGAVSSWTGPGAFAKAVAAIPGSAGTGRAGNITPAAPANGVITVSPGYTDTISSNLIVPPTVAVVFSPGAKIAVGRSVSLILPQNTICQPTQQCFDISAGRSSVRFSRPPENISPVWFGADPTNNPSTATITTAAFNAASAALGTGNGARMICPPGIYNLNSTFLILNTYGAEFDGAGYACSITWSGNSAGPVVYSRGNISSHFRNFSVQISSSNPVAKVFEISDSTATSSADLIENVQINCGSGSSGGYCTDGFLVDGPDANNDFHYWRNVRVLSYTRSAFHLLGGQSYSHYFEMCQALGIYEGATGLYGVYSPGTGGYSASFTWKGGGMSSSVWDFYVGGDTIFPINIYDIDNESSGGLVYAHGGNFVSFYGGRWYGTHTGSTLVADIAGFSANFRDIWIAPNGGYTKSNLLTFSYSPQVIGAVSGGWVTMDGVTLNTSNFTSRMLFPAGPQDARVVLRNTTWTDPATNAWGTVIDPRIQGQVYSAGTLSATNGSPTLTGSGVSWTPAMAGTVQDPGSINISGHTYNIERVNSPASITLVTKFVGATGNGLSYTIGYNAAFASFPTLNAGSATLGHISGTVLNLSGNSLNAPNATAYLAQLNVINSSAAGSTDNALVSPAGLGPALSVGTTIRLILSHSLQAGPNTLAYQQGAALPVRNQYGSNLGKGYAAGNIVTMTFNNAGGGYWQIVGSN